ncbi:MAG: hypothetical protein RBR68_13565, partial [Tenuifilaceae bacterium]|nr:hypothetical protein [Tenuifilaceae bacterium]
MAWLIANPDGTSNAKVGDRVVTGGGIFEKLADGTSKLIDALPTGSGKTSSYSEVQRIYANIVNATGGDGSNQGSLLSPVVEDTSWNYDSFTVEDTSWNYDSFTGVGDDYDFTSGSSSLNMSNIIGYGIVFLVG